MPKLRWILGPLVALPFLVGCAGGQGGGDGGTFSALALLAGKSNVLGALDGTGAAARFSSPAGLALDGSGHLYVADTANSEIREVVVATGVVTTVAGGKPGGADGTGSSASFVNPQGLALDGAGNLYVADTGGSTIRKIETATWAVTTVAGSPGVPGSADGTGAAARFNQPTGLAIDGAGDLFVADSGNSTIRKVVVASGAVTTLAGSAGVEGSSDGTGTAAGFSRPLAVALDGAGNLYVADAVNSTIRTVVVATGVVTTLAGSPLVYGSADGKGSAASFGNPSGLVLDGVGNLYVTDIANATIRKVAISTATVSTVAGVPGQHGLELGPLPAGLNQPYGLAYGPGPSLFISDSAANVLLRLY